MSRRGYWFQDIYPLGRPEKDRLEPVTWTSSVCQWVQSRMSPIGPYPLHVGIRRLSATASCGSKDLILWTRSICSPPFLHSKEGSKTRKRPSAFYNIILNASHRHVVLMPWRTWTPFSNAGLHSRPLIGLSLGRITYRIALRGWKDY